MIRKLMIAFLASLMMFTSASSFKINLDKPCEPHFCTKLEM